MVTNFALSLSFEGISLLSRNGDVWHVVGDVALDASDMESQLTGLRDRAVELGAQDAQVHLIIPNEQIRYLEAGNGTDDTIRAALDGATPYDINDLAYDHEMKGEAAVVAAVAKETLGEAEGFATAHGFTPVSHVAIAPEGTFVNAVHFGLASNAPATAEALRDAIKISDAPLPEPAPAEPEIEEPVEEAEPLPVFMPSKTTAQVEADKEPEPVAETVEDAIPDAKVEDAIPEAKVDAPQAVAPTVEADATLSEEASGPKPTFSTIRATRDVLAPEIAKAPAAPKIEVPKPVKADAAKAPDVRFTPVVTAKDKTNGASVTAENLESFEEKDSGSKLGGFFSRRKPQQPKTPPPVAKPVEPEAPKQAAIVHSSAPGPRTETPQEPSQSAAALSRLAAIKAKAGRGSAAPASSATAMAVDTDDERQRMTVFGERSTQIGGKPRFLGLFLTAALLLFLAGVAAWASVFLDDGLARFFSTEPSDTEVASLPSVESSIVPLPNLLGGTEADESAGDIQLAALDTGETGLLTDTDRDIATVAAPRALSPSEAEATYAATGIWQRAPTSPLLPNTGQVDDVYIASIDLGVQQFDAVALPDPLDMAQEPALRNPGLPPRPGVRFRLDDRGLVRATPEGTVNPDGILVFAGRPPAVPPLRAAIAAPITPDADSADNPLAYLAALRPSTRPTDLIEQKERADLGGRTRAELQKIRPTARAKTVQEEVAAAEPDAPATKYAVKTSLQPVTRPRNMAAIVRKAEKEKARAPAPVQQAALTQRTVKPSAPTANSVAKQATVRNAINLNKINLIGVYGTPSKRRALVRLANGSYKKVKVGDRIDGGRVQAIGDSELRYVKSGRNVTLKMPRT